MSKTTKFLVGVVVAGSLVPSLAFAASIPNLKFDNNQTTRDCSAGQTVNFTARVNVPAGEVVEKVQVDVISDNLAPVLAHDVGGAQGLEEGQHDVNLTVTCPQNTGFYSVEVRTAGIFGGQHSNSITDGVVSVANFGNAIRVVASTSGSSTGGSSSENDVWKTILASLQAIIAKLEKPTGGSTESAACAELTKKMNGTMPGATSEANTRLQGFLLSEGASIPALASGASFGYFGAQTQAAVNWYKSVNSCK